MITSLLLPSKEMSDNQYDEETIINTRREYAYSHFHEIQQAALVVLLEYPFGDVQRLWNIHNSLSSRKSSHDYSTFANFLDHLPESPSLMDLSNLLDISYVEAKNLLETFCRMFSDIDRSLFPWTQSNSFTLLKRERLLQSRKIENLIKSEDLVLLEYFDLLPHIHGILSLFAQGYGINDIYVSQGYPYQLNQKMKKRLSTVSSMMNKVLLGIDEDIFSLHQFFHSCLLCNWNAKTLQNPNYEKLLTRRVYSKASIILHTDVVTQSGDRYLYYLRELFQSIHLYESVLNNLNEPTHSYNWTLSNTKQGLLIPNTLPPFFKLLIDLGIKMEEQQPYVDYIASHLQETPDQVKNKFSAGRRFLENMILYRPQIEHEGRITNVLLSRYKLVNELMTLLKDRLR